jgi:CRP-like cAMP-binding protein
MAKDVILEADLGGTPLSPEELAAVPDFSEIKPKIWEKFPGAIAKKTFRAGELVFQEGNHGTTAFYIFSGVAEIFLGGTILSAQSKKGPKRGLFGKITKLTNYVKGVPDRGPRAASARTHIPLDGSIDVPIENPIAELGAGELFGELSALAALKQERVKRAKFYPRSASVRAKTDMTVFEMLPNILNNVLYNSKAFKDKLNDNYRRRALDTHLLSVPIFRDGGQEFRDYLRDRVE